MHEPKFALVYHFSESPKRVWGHYTGSLVDRLFSPWPLPGPLVQSGPQISVFTAIWTSPQISDYLLKLQSAHFCYAIASYAGTLRFHRAAPLSPAFIPMQ